MVKSVLKATTEVSALDVSPFNIHTVILEPGFFRTKIFGRSQISTNGISGSYTGTRVDYLIQVLKGLPAKLVVGDPGNLEKRFVEWIGRTEMAEGITEKVYIILMVREGYF
jgi:hypothetical protein